MSAPQLRMGFARFDELEAPVVPEGYKLRTFRPGDEEAWLAILSEGNFGVWDRPRLDRMLAGARGRVPFDGIFFLTSDDTPVATACTCVFDGEEGEYSELGWVAVVPEHRGQGLARVVCLAVLNYARRLGHTYTFLKTEVYRPAAIKTYLRIGFEPEITDSAHEEIWTQLKKTLAAGSDA